MNPNLCRPDFDYRIDFEDALAFSASIYRVLKPNQTDRDIYDLMVEQEKGKVQALVESRYCYDWTQDLIDRWAVTDTKWQTLLADFGPE